MIQLAAILGILLAVSVAGNAWQFHHGEKLVAAKAATEQLATDTKAAAEACSASVDRLDKAGKARQGKLEAALKSVAPAIAKDQKAALDALKARPSDPANLCGSLEKYLRDQIKAERK